MYLYIYIYIYIYYKKGVTIHIQKEFSIHMHIYTHIDDRVMAFERSYITSIYRFCWRAQSPACETEARGLGKSVTVYIHVSAFTEACGL